MRQDMSSTELQKAINRCWTIADLVERCGVTGMTIHNWRKRGLPVVSIKGRGRPALRFVPSEVIKWARQNDVDIAA